ncbi:MAG: hypothetical protein Q8Q31_01515 [Nanoarchaeota archaeon]|nr:hypothetical protein [Nanoarchaeota archaeon]
MNTEDGKKEIVTLCGSTRFKEIFFKVARKLQFEEDKVVLLPLEFCHSDGNRYDNKQLELLDRVHRVKIDISDCIFVIDVEGYIGESTKNEINYAAKSGKAIRYYSKETGGIK